MERKQIYLATEQEERLRQMAEQEHTTVSALIRNAIDVYLLEHQTPAVRPEDHPIWSIIGIVSGPDIPRDGAEEHDKYIYGPRL
jgi:hypothetical protein